jgi:hypothetical protein
LNEIVMHQHTRPDIVHYVHDQLMGPYHLTRLLPVSPQVAIVADAILDMSEGVFLWIVLVVDMVLRYRD